MATLWWKQRSCHCDYSISISLPSSSSVFLFHTISLSVCLSLLLSLSIFLYFPLSLTYSLSKFIFWFPSPPALQHFRGWPPCSHFLFSSYRLRAPLWRFVALCLCRACPLYTVVSLWPKPQGEQFIDIQKNFFCYSSNIKMKDLCKYKIFPLGIYQENAGLILYKFPS